MSGLRRDLDSDIEEEAWDMFAVMTSDILKAERTLEALLSRVQTGTRRVSYEWRKPATSVGRGRREADVWGVDKLSETWLGAAYACAAG
jgi:hypothetical protein